MPAASIQLNRFILADEGRKLAAPSWLSRVYAGIQAIQMKRAEAEVARMIEARGGRFNDALEREIERRAV